LQQATKQRIAGSVVLIALALIFLPIIFDGQGSYDTQISSRIPPAPIIIPMANPVPTRPGIIANQPDFAAALPASDDTELEPSEIEPTNSTAVTIDSIVAAIIDESSAKRGTQTAPGLGSEAAEVVESAPGYLREAPQLGPDGLPQGWSVRLGTFSEQDNATKLLERLLNSGYKAYVRDIGREEATLTGVFVGPWLDRNRVDDYQKELQDEFKLAGYVVRYTIGIP
jgi:DedD protein